MFSLEERDIGGIFASKKHVSFEFGNGSSLDDPNGVLEGTGKSRRHLKLTSLTDVREKNVKHFVLQTLGNQK